MNDAEKRTKEFIENIKREFIEKHTKLQIAEELIFINNVEKTNVNDYHGREILELLQNADDAFQKSINSNNKPSDELNVSIVYKNNVLSISNTGTFFDEDGIIAIIQSHNSPKKGKYIGNKGTGFRSILNWADKVRIFSGEYNLEFSKDIAKEIFDEIKGSEQVQKQLGKKPDLYVPMLSVPKYLTSKGQYDKASTTIEITINSEKNEDDFSVLKQLGGMDYRILLFLPNIAKITIETENDITVYTRLKKEKNRTASLKIEDVVFEVLIEKKVNGQVENEETYTIFSRVLKEAITEDEIQKDVYTTIAVPCEEADISSPLYTYFPILNTETPFNCIMNATYVLSGNRDSINRSETNKRIVLLQLEHLKSIAEYYIQQKNYEKALSVLTPKNITSNNWYNWKFTQGFSSFLVEENFISLIKDLKLLTTVNGEGISLNEHPLMIDGEFPDLFRGEKFSMLLKPLIGERTKSFIKMLSNKYGVSLVCDENNLCEMINASSSNWTDEDRVGVFVWWSNRYSQYLPKLLKNQDNIWINKGESCFFLDGDFKAEEMPTWVKTPSLSTNEQRILFEKTKEKEEVKRSIEKAQKEGKSTAVSRIICDSTNLIYPLIDFQYRDRNSVISAVNASVDSYDKAKDFTRWLWKGYSDENEDWMPPKRNGYPYQNYHFPAFNKQDVLSGDNLYFGKEYENELANQLFIENGFDCFPSVEELGIDIQDKEKFVKFFSKFGVKKFPSIMKQKIEKPLETYENYIKEKIKVDYRYRVVRVQNCEWKTILGIENILKTLSTVEIIKWVIEDETLKNHLKNLKENSAKVEILADTQRKYWQKNYNGELKNYVLFLFNEIAWVKIGENKYKPREILIEKEGGLINSKFSDLVPYISRAAMKLFGDEIGVGIEIIKEVFDLFDFCKTILDLNSNDFYGLLLNLPNHENKSKAVDIYRSIYRAVEDLGDVKKEFAESENKAKFFNDGKVLVRYNNESCYHLARESFLPSTKIIIKRDLPIIEKASRSGKKENFTAIFNCQEYNRTIEIDEKSIVFNTIDNEFQNYFKEFKKYAKAYKYRCDNVAKNFDKITMKLVSEISVLENSEIKSVNEEYVLTSKTATEFYITIFGNEFDVRRISEYIEDIFSNIANTAGFDASKLGELFRTKDKDTREFLIRKEFYSLSVLEDCELFKALKKNFEDAVLKIAPNYQFCNLDYENFSSNENVEKIINLFNEIGITTIKQLNEKGFEYPLSFNNYYLKKVNDFIRSEERNYVNYLYYQALNDEKKQETFYADRRKFNNYNFLERTVDKEIDVVSVEEHLIKVFGDWKNSSIQVDAEGKYSQNYKKMNPNKEFEEFIGNDDRIRILIYFNREEEFLKWLDVKREENQKEKASTIDVYADVKNVIPILEEVVLSGAIVEFSSNSSSGYGYSKSYNSFTEEKRQRQKKIIGNKGEQLVYNLLSNDTKIKKVRAVSEAFVALGILSAGQADSTKGYDIEYEDESGDLYYVEVKSGSSNTFTMSPKELEFAKKNADKYELYLVYEIDEKTPKATKLPNRFWELEDYKMNEIIEKIEVRF